MKKIVFGVNQKIDGVTSLQDMQSPTALEALEGILMLSIPADSSRSVSITVSDVVISANTRHSLASVGVSIIVSYIVEVLIHNPQVTNSSDVYIAVKDILSSYVSNGDFTLAMQNSGITALLGASSLAITVDTYSESEVPAFPSPTSSPVSKQSSLSEQGKVYVIVGAVVGGVACFVLLGFIGWSVFSAKKLKNGTKKTTAMAIVPLQSDLTFIDIERLNTPDSARIKNAVGVVHTSEGDAEVFVQRRAHSQKYSNKPEKRSSKGRSFFDFSGGGDFGGLYGVFTRSPANPAANYNIDNLADGDQDVVEGPDQPDREAIAHNEHAASHFSPFHHQKSGLINGNGDVHLSKLGSIRSNDSGLFFQDDASSVDSDTPIVLRHTLKHPVHVSSPPVVLDSSSQQAAVLSHDMPSELDNHNQTVHKIGSNDWQLAHPSEKDHLGRF
jgi:hypothetical protein